MKTRRFLLSVIGTPDDNLNDDLQEISDEHGVYYVEGKGMFICTFYSEYSVDELYEILSYLEAMMIFDITEQENFAVQLPKKYHLALFPEIKQLYDGLKSHNVESNKDEVKQSEEFITIDDILDKLSKNNYDRKCLTKNELNILKNHQ